MPRIFLGDDIEFQNGMIVSYQDITDNTYTITNTSGAGGGQEYAMGVNTTSTAKVINLPKDDASGSSAAKVVGRMYYIFDLSANASNNNITINAGTNGDIIGNIGISPTTETLTLSGDGDSVSLLCISAGNDTDGGIWKVI